MKRIIYAPKVWVYIRAKNQNLYDISDYVVSGTVERRLNQVSSATVTFRNPNRVFTKFGDPAFLPMDPITIFMQRHINTPVRTFTGYIDESPYYQMRPGVATIKASCTLKRLQYTFWDPALPFVMDLLKKLGWGVDLSNGLLLNTNTLGGGPVLHGDLSKTIMTDGSMGKLLYTILNLVGGWDDANIWIEQLPPDLVKWITTLYTKLIDENALATATGAAGSQADTLKALLGDIIGTTTLGSGGISGSGSGSSSSTAAGSGTAPTNAPAGAWNVIASQESTDLGSNSGGGCGSHQSSASLDGWSELMNCNSMGGLPCDTQLWISANGKTIKANKVDCGGGSSYGAGSVITQIGLYPRVSDYLGLSGGGPYHVTIWRVDGQPIHPSGGVQTSSSTAVTSPTTPAAQKGIRAVTSSGSGTFTTNIARATTASIGSGLSGATNSIGSAVSSTVSSVNSAAAPAPGPISPPSHSDHILPSKDAGGTRSSTSLIILHDSEIPCGGGALDTLYNVLDGQGLSVHAGVNCDGSSVRLAQDDTLCYHVVSYNDRSLGIEQIGYASQTSWPQAQLQTTAQWIAYWAVKYNIPITFSTSHGVARHSDLGTSGGGHSDPGAGYPFDQVLNMAKQLAAGHSVAAGSTGSPGAGAGSGSGTGSGLSQDQVFQIAKGVAFATELQWPAIADTIEAVALQGHKSLMNDKPLLSFVQQVTTATMRSFQSAPNGDFFAFFPDHFGEFHHRSPYWNIHDIEVITGDIQLTDAALCTHMYVVGDTLGAGAFGDASTKLLETILSAGSVDIFDYFGSGLNHSEGGGSKTGGYTETPMLAHSMHDKSAALAFLNRYGARPIELDQPLIRSQFFEAFFALQSFMIAWSQQFATDFTFTFMPELYPGGRVTFDSQGINMYIESVTHNFDYENGFTTVAELSSPAAANETNFSGTIQSPAWGMVNSIIS